MPTDDELAQTATQAEPVAAGSKALWKERETLGRFTLERVLGAGGMGVVHAAFDPELERRVALKVLQTNSADSRARLLREARAMAKLSHDNVITVFEVGSVDGEDFVAMELIDGGTLGDWIDRDKPAWRDVVAAFVAAGRGLVAAHAEGLVHRDFKPSNVLRAANGRIVVTDFGLARSVGADEAGRGSVRSLVLDQTASPTAAALTRTGSFLGTPAYMSPEQWRSEVAMEATDQFAFCIALWEALTGKRPFSGDTLGELRNGVLRGPVDLDASAIPRRLRPIVRRGLAVDPAERWPSMTELLRAIERATSRRPAVALAGAGLLVAGVAIYVATRSPAGPTCVPPAIDPDTVTSADAKPYLDQWKASREVACEAEPEVRALRLVCLDGVMARIADAFHDGNPGPDGLPLELVDPAACDAARPPRLTMPIGDRLSRAFALLRQSRQRGKRVQNELSATIDQPCVQTVAGLAALPRIMAETDPDEMGSLAVLAFGLESIVPQCDDDGIKAVASFEMADHSDPSSLERAEQAAKQFPGTANTAWLFEARADVAEDNGQYADAIAGYEAARAIHAVAGRNMHELAVVLHLGQLHLLRGTPGDLDAVMVLAEKYGERARALGRTMVLSWTTAQALWIQGHVELADRRAKEAGYLKLTAKYFDAKAAPQDVKGTVVDDEGKPVANAKVVAASELWGDDAELSSPIANVSTAVETTTGPDGKFELRGARGTAMAAEGDRVSAPALVAPSIVLRLGPTSTIEGDVQLGKEPAGRVRVIAFISGKDTVQVHTGPVDTKGHYKLSRIPRGNIEITVGGIDQTRDFDPQILAVKTPTVIGPRLAMPWMGQLHVVGRPETETKPEWTYVEVFRGAHPGITGTLEQVIAKLGASAGSVELDPTDLATLAAPFKGHVEAGDVIGELNQRPAGDLTLCAVGLSKKGLTKGMDKVASFMMDADTRCVVVPADVDLVTLAVPPAKRVRRD